LGGIFRSRSRAVPFLAEQCLIGCAARSLAKHVGPPRARNATLAVALSGSICPSSTPATPRWWSSGQARAAHTRVELTGAGRPDVNNTVAKRLICLTSQVGMMYGLQVMDQDDISVDARASHAHATMRSEAFQRPSHCCPRKHYLNHTRVGRSCMAGSTFPMSSLLSAATASYLTRPWSLRLELTSWLEARSASTPCPLLLAGVHIAVASTDCVVPLACVQSRTSQHRTGRCLPRPLPLSCASTCRRVCVYAQIYVGM
jgi:hypothetical protein